MKGSRAKYRAKDKRNPSKYVKFKVWKDRRKTEGGRLGGRRARVRVYK